MTTSHETKPIFFKKSDTKSHKHINVFSLIIVCFKMITIVFNIKKQDLVLKYTFNGSFVLEFILSNGINTQFKK